MHSSTLLVFLAFTGMASGTIYWFTGAPSSDKLQTQLRLISHAYKHKNNELLDALVHSGSSAARAVQTFGSILEQTKLESAAPHTETSIQGVVSFNGNESGASKFKLVMVPCKESPTGYKLKEAMNCHYHLC